MQPYLLISAYSAERKEPARNISVAMYAPDRQGMGDLRYFRVCLLSESSNETEFFQKILHLYQSIVNCQHFLCREFPIVDGGKSYISLAFLPEVIGNVGADT